MQTSIACGARFDYYEIEAPLGEGGMASVWRVRHLKLRGVRALKVLKIQNPELEERLRREGRAQHALAHPNVVQVLDLVETPWGPGLILEFVNGPNLSHLLARGRLSLERLDGLAAGILRGVRAAHQLGFVHRDLKPGNVLLAAVDGELVPKVADFGLVKETAERGELTQSGVGFGTPRYMAPEQFESTRDVDARADIFALGAILYEMAGGRQAFEGDGLAILKYLLDNRRPPITALAPELPPRMATAIEGALVADRGARIPDCDTLLSVWEGRLEWSGGSAPSDLPASSTRWSQELRALPGAPVASQQGTSSNPSLVTQELPSQVRGAARIKDRPMVDWNELESLLFEILTDLNAVDEWVSALEPSPPFQELHENILAKNVLDDHPYDLARPAARDLRDLLAGTIFRDSDIEQLLEEATIRVALVRMRGSATDIWRSALGEAANMRLLRRLVRRAQELRPAIEERLRRIEMISGSVEEFKARRVLEQNDARSAIVEALRIQAPDQQEEIYGVLGLQPPSPSPTPQAASTLVPCSRCSDLVHQGAICPHCSTRIRPDVASNDKPIPAPLDEGPRPSPARSRIPAMSLLAVGTGTFVSVAGLAISVVLVVLVVGLWIWSSAPPPTAAITADETPPVEHAPAPPEQRSPPPEDPARGSRRGNKDNIKNPDPVPPPPEEPQRAEGGSVILELGEEWQRVLLRSREAGQPDVPLKQGPNPVPPGKWEVLAARSAEAELSSQDELDVVAGDIKELACRMNCRAK
jgi:serine/threonine protein kinase